MPTRLIRASLIAAVFASVLAASCGDAAPEGAPPDTTSGASGSSAASPTDTNEVGSPGGFVPIDPATGSLKLVATGPDQGSWTFKDVNGSVSEQAGGGQTLTLLQLEAHQDPVHFKIRVGGTDELEAGRYTIGDADQGVDATYERAGRYYKSVGSASGTVELTSLTDDRAVGTYNMTLETLEEKPVKAQVSGSFDMRVQR